MSMIQTAKGSDSYLTRKKSVGFRWYLNCPLLTKHNIVFIEHNTSTFQTLWQGLGTQQWTKETRPLPKGIYSLEGNQHQTSTQADTQLQAFIRAMNENPHRKWRKRVTKRDYSRWVARKGLFEVLELGEYLVRDVRERKAWRTVRITISLLSWERWTGQRGRHTGRILVLGFRGAKVELPVKSQTQVSRCNEFIQMWQDQRWNLILGIIPM